MRLLVLLLPLAAAAAACSADSADAPAPSAGVLVEARGGEAPAVARLGPAPEARAAPGLAFEDLSDVLQFPTTFGGEPTGSGVGAFDYDSDGDIDLLFGMGNARARLYRNDGGFRFTEASDEAQLELKGSTYGVAVGDCDADGDQDLVVTSYLGKFFHRNERGVFVDETAASGIDTRTYFFSSAAFFDADGDGDLDLAVNCYKGDADGCSDELFLNDGACRFTDVSAERGFTEMGWGNAVGAEDFDGDGDPDLAISNDFGFTNDPNRLFVNDGTGRFAERSAELGFDVGVYGMGGLIADLNGDLRWDYVCANICENAVLLGQPDGTFREAGRELGLLTGWYLDPAQAPRPNPNFREDGDEIEQLFARFARLYTDDRPPGERQSFCLTSWGISQADPDADGRREIYVANGEVGIGMFPEGYWQPNRLYTPRDDGTYEDIAAAVGLGDDTNDRSEVWVDLDGDARLDLVVTTWPNVEDGDRTVYQRVFRNVTSPGRMGAHAFLRLRGRAPNLDGIGARVEVSAGGTTQLFRQTFATSYLGASTAPLHVGVGDATVIDEVIVRWPWGGGVDRFTNVPVGGTVELVQGSSPWSEARQGE